MSKLNVLLTGVLLTAVILLAANGLRPALASGNGPYQLARHSNTSASAGVFRIDTSTGAVSYCYITPSVDLVCTKEVQ